MNVFKTCVYFGALMLESQEHFWNIERVFLSTQLLTVMVIWITQKLVFTCAHIHLILGLNFKRGAVTSGSQRVLGYSR